MEHIHNLVIVDVKYRQGDAYVSTNSVHNALFARTCMLSRTTYKGCKVQFYPDECDVALPQRVYAPRNPPAASTKKAPGQVGKGLGNRFGLLELDSGERSSDEENRTPSDGESEGDGANLGVSLDFLD
jgi:hypothetical protein